MFTASPSPDSWGFALLLLRQLGYPGGVMPVEVSIGLSNGRHVVLPLFPPDGATTAPPLPPPGEFTPNPAQLRILAILARGPKSSTQLRDREPHVYDRPRGIHQLVEVGLVVRAANGKWQLTPFGRDWCDEQGIGEEDDDEEK